MTSTSESAETTKTRASLSDDSRLRTLPYLPASQRPAVIRSDKGKEIAVDKIKVEDKEKILRRGEVSQISWFIIQRQSQMLQVIHKRLEREIHPEEVVILPSNEEEKWGLKQASRYRIFGATSDVSGC